jgi:hypothetical protein
MTITRELSFNLSGSVTNMGLAILGTTIRLYDYEYKCGALVKRFLIEQVTSTKGTFNFDVRKGVYCIEIVPGENTRFARQSLENIKVTSNTTFSIVLKAGSILSGLVRDHQGKAVGNAEILVFGIEPHVLRVAQEVESDGTYSISLPGGRYYLCAYYKNRADGAQKKRLPPDKPFLCPVTEVVDLQRDLKRDFVLPELIKFQGVATNTAGHPVSGVKATVHATEKPDTVFANQLPLSVSCVTGKDGKFEAYLKTGSYNVKLEPPADSHLAERQFGSVLVDQDRTKAYSLDAGQQLSGRVTHRRTPVAGAKVTILGIKSESSQWTDEDGYFVFSLGTGAYELIVTAQADPLGQENRPELAPWTTNVILDKSTEVNVELDEGILVSGRVLDPVRQPREGVLLSVYPSRGATNDMALVNKLPLCVGITGNDGAYEFRLRPDTYRLVLNNQPSTAHTIVVGSGSRDKDLTVEDVCVVKFEVVSEEEVPIPNCLVSYEMYRAGDENDELVPELLEPSMTGEDGKIIVTVPSGIYSVHFQPPGESEFALRHIRQLSVIKDMTRRIRLSRKTAETE